MLLAGCGSTSGASSSTPASVPVSATVASTTASTATEASPGKVTYKVETSAAAKISYGNVASMATAEVRAGDWSKAGDMAAIDTLQLTVMSADAAKDATVSCEILVDGVSKSKKTGSGLAAVAMCLYTNS
jgi:hypothetical protein